MTPTGVQRPVRTDDISVIGFDNSYLARLSHINLTTVAQDVTEMATLTVRRLVARLEGSPADLERESVLPPRLVIRGSTGPGPGTIG